MIEIEEIKKNPHRYIEDWMEGNLLHIGRKAFTILALLPCSLILPDIFLGTMRIRCTMNVLCIGPPSSGKSTLCNKFSNITYYPYCPRRVSPAKLADKLSEMNIFSFIVEDFSEISENNNPYDTIKIIEGALGEEQRISRENMKSEINTKTHGIGLICGTWYDLSKYLDYFRGGLFFRQIFIFLNLTKKEKQEISEFISRNIGDGSFSENLMKKENIVKEYYNELYKIQGNNNKNISQIIGYYFSEKIKTSILKKFTSLTANIHEDISSEANLIREHHDAYRILVTSAFLNIFNRKVEKGILYPDEDDLNLAEEIMEMNIKNKVGILKSERFLSILRSSSELQRVVKDSNIDPMLKNILLALSPFKKVNLS